MRLVVLLFSFGLGLTVHGSERVCETLLLQTAQRMHDVRLPLRKRLAAAAQFRDHALPQLDKAEVVWTDMPHREEMEPLATPGISIVPLRNGVDLNEFAADISENYGAHYDFDLAYLATRFAGAAVRFRTTYASLLGSKEAILQLQPGVYERHELDHLDMDWRRNHGIPSLFHGRLTQQRDDDPFRIGSYPHPSFDELYAYARDIAHAVRGDSAYFRWSAISVSARRLRRMSERIGTAARDAIAHMDDGDEEGWFEWEVLRQRPSWRVPVFRFLNVRGQPQIQLADYSEPVAMEPSRFPAIQVPKLTIQLLTRTITNLRMLAIARRAIDGVPAEHFPTDGLLTTLELTIRTQLVIGGTALIRVRVYDGNDWQTFDAPPAESSAYLATVLGRDSERPLRRLRNYDQIFQVARERFERLSSACAVLQQRSAQITDAARSGRLTEATDLALSFEPFLDALDEAL